MLGSLTGPVSARLGSRLLIEVGGVGYWVHTGGWQPEGTITAYLYHQVREDADELFGFADLPGLELFEQLISISGIGPKAALAVLSVGSAERLRQAISEQDTAYLTAAPGIGQKAAQKIILELHGKVDLSMALPGDGQADIVAALEGLGYKLTDIRSMLKDLPANLTVDEQIRWALRSR